MRGHGEIRRFRRLFRFGAPAPRPRFERSTVILQSQFDELLAFASDASLMPELLKAKAVYFGATGEVFEDDDSFEQRMAAFRDFYVFDWKIEDDAATPAERFWRRGQFACPDDAPLFEGFLQTWLSLWEVRKLGKESLRLRDLFTERDVEVFERRQLIGLSKGDILEARLLPMGEKRVLSDAVIFHPSVVRKAILAEIKRRKKYEPDFDRRAFVWSLSKMHLKFGRYRNISPEQIYDFPKK